MKKIATGGKCLCAGANHDEYAMFYRVCKLGLVCSSLCCVVCLFVSW